MYHSITFQKCNSNGAVTSSKNTWDDWHLAPSSRPVFAPPAQKTRFLDIPGADGLLDMSEALTGYPVFENRQGSFEFIVINESDELSAPGTNYGLWHQRYTEIMEFLHGKELRAVLEDDVDYFYEGRFSVNAWASEEERSKITIDYSVRPYKYSTITSLEPNWLWDELDFTETANTPNATNLNESRFNAVAVNSMSSWTNVVVTRSDLGVAPTCPILRVHKTSAQEEFKFKYNDKERVLSEGDNKLYNVVLYGQAQHILSFKGRGTVSIEFREGRL